MALPQSLKERMAAATPAAPSMIPQEYAPPPKQEETPKQLSDLVQDKKDYLMLRRLIEQAMQWKEAPEEAEKRKEAAKMRKPLEDKIKTLLGRYGVGKAMLDDLRVNYYSSSRPTIDAKLLLAAGVAPRIIQDCTVTKASYTLKLWYGKDEDDS